jgi:hypothetical protein
MECAKKPVNVLQQGANVDTIAHIAAITVARAIRLDARANSATGSSPPR